MNKVFLLTAFWGISLISVAQRETIKYQPYVDIQKYHFGFHVGLHVTDLSISQMGEELQNDHWFAGIPSYNPGLSVGIIADRRLHQFLNLRISPTVHLANRKMCFHNMAVSQKEYVNITSGYLQLPADIKFSSLRLNNYRPYLIGGIYGMYDFGGKIADNLRMKKWDYGFSFGVGCDLYFYYFRFSSV